MPNNSNNNIHSEEINEMIGTIPNRLLRWGLLIILLVFLGVIAACYFIKHPEVVPVPIELTSYNPPVNLKSKQSKRIERLYFADGDSVVAGGIIAQLESVASYRDILSLERIVIRSEGSWEAMIRQDSLYRDYSLGDIQNIFVQFRKQCADFSNFISMSLLPQKRVLLEGRIEKQNNILLRQEQQYRLLMNEFELYEKGYKRDSAIFSVNGITLVELERSKQSFLKKESEIIGFSATISGTENAILSLKEQLIENTIQENTERDRYYTQLNELKQQLSTEFEKWKKEYLIISPIGGVVSLSKYWSENQNVSVDEVVATVIPFDNKAMIGKGTVSHAQYSKVKVGQKVNVKLDNYPYMKYGMVTGVVGAISLVPQEKGYSVDILFPKELYSNYGIDLNYTYQMTGIADIVTDDIRLIEQFLYPIKDLIYKIEK